MSTITGLLYTSSMRGTQALQILQDHSVSGAQARARMSGDGSTSPYAFVGVAGQASRAVSAIMEILLDAQGNQHVSIQAKDGYAAARTGGGNDELSIDVGQAYRVSSGGGNDIIAIKAYGDHDELAPGFNPSVYDTDGGGGDDTISIESDGMVDVTFGGEGNDSIAISTSDIVLRTDGGSGDDTIDIKGARVVSGVWAGDGNDIIRVTAPSPASGAAVTFSQVGGISGDAGNDIIEVTADVIGVNGGTGDDTIMLHNTGTLAAGVSLQRGGGHDEVTVDSAVRMIMGGPLRQDMAQASIERIDANTLKITYDDLGDSVTVHFDGDMADQPLALDFDQSGALTVRRADAPNTDPFLANHKVTETRYF